MKGQVSHTTESQNGSWIKSTGRMQNRWKLKNQATGLVSIQRFIPYFLPFPPKQIQFIQWRSWSASTHKGRTAPWRQAENVLGLTQANHPKSGNWKSPLWRGSRHYWQFPQERRRLYDTNIAQGSRAGATGCHLAFHSQAL